MTVLYFQKILLLQKVAEEFPPSYVVKFSLEALIGPEASGLSQSTVSRLKREWAEQYDTWRRDLSEGRWVYIWVDGIYSNIRGDNPRLCVLVGHRGERIRGEALPGY